MSKFQIQYGLGGGFGGAGEWETIEAKDLAAAEKEAFNSACEEYDMYDGMHGLRTVADIMEEDELNEDEAEETWREERESWLDYAARPFVELSHDQPALQEEGK